MSSEDAVKAIERQLDDAESYFMIFGPLGSGSKEDQKTVLKKAFHNLLLIVHEDKLATLPIPVQKRGKKVFNRLQTIHENAAWAVSMGSYQESFPPGMNPDHPATIELQGSQDIYRLEQNPFKTGDFSTLYRGQSTTGVRVVAKIATTPPNNLWLEREAEILGRFHGPDANKKVIEIAPFVPKMLDSFLVSTGGRRYRVNIMQDVLPDVISVTGLMKAFPDGMDPKDGAWVCRRVIALSSAAAMIGVVHGAIVPDHVVVQIQSHDPIHIGWAHSIEPGECITTIIDRWKDWYPPEVFDKKPATLQTDIYMAGKTMIALLGGDPAKNTFPDSVPKQMADPILKCVALKPQDRYKLGKEALDEITKGIRAVYGSKYRQLVLPVVVNQFADVGGRVVD